MQSIASQTKAKTKTETKKKQSLASTKSGKTQLSVGLIVPLSTISSSTLFPCIQVQLNTFLILLIGPDSILLPTLFAIVIEKCKYGRQLKFASRNPVEKEQKTRSQTTEVNSEKVREGKRILGKRDMGRVENNRQQRESVIRSHSSVSILRTWRRLKDSLITIIVLLHATFIEGRAAASLLTLFHSANSRSRRFHDELYDDVW